MFFINNLDCMLGIFAERRIQSEEVQRFEELLLRQREGYVEEELMGSFPKLITFVLETERKILAAGGRGAAAGVVDEKVGGPWRLMLLEVLFCVSQCAVPVSAAGRGGAGT